MSNITSNNNNNNNTWALGLVKTCIYLALFYGCTFIFGISIYAELTKWFSVMIFSPSLFLLTMPILFATFISILVVPNQPLLLFIHQDKKQKTTTRENQPNDIKSSFRSCCFRFLQYGCCSCDKISNTMHSTSFWMVLPILFIHGLIMLAAFILFPNLSIYLIANLCGYISLFYFGLLFLPLQLDPLLGLFGISPPAALPLHIWFGTVAVGTGGIHSLLYIIKFIEVQQQLWTLMDFNFCNHGKFTSISNNNYQNDNNEPYHFICSIKRQAPEGPSGHHRPNHNNIDCPCEMQQFYITGIIAMIAFLALTLIALIRRTKYKLFYQVHIIGAIISVIFTILHFRESLYFLMGGLLVYASTHIPSYMKRLLHSQQAPILQAILLPGEQQDCLSLQIAATKDTITKWIPGCYIQLRLSSLLFFQLGHPYSIFPCGKDRLQLLIRIKGQFTKQLLKSITTTTYTTKSKYIDTTQQQQQQQQQHFICDEAMPLLSMDGFYGYSNLLEEIMSHDSLALVAGGIGIVPILGILTRIEDLLYQFSTTNNSLQLYWVCRDQALINHVQDQILPNILSSFTTTTTTNVEDDNNVEATIMTIHVYKTGKCSTSTVIGKNNNNDTFMEDDQHEPYEKVVLSSSNRLYCPPWAATDGFVTSVDNNNNIHMIRVVTYLLIAVPGCGMMVYYCEMEQSLLGLFGLFFLAIIVSTFGFLYSYPTHQQHWQQQNNFSNEIMNLDKDSNTNNNFFVSKNDADFTTYGTIEEEEEVASGLLSQSPFSVEVLWKQNYCGRPNLAELVSSMRDNYDNPAIFVCGPEGMVKTLRNECSAKIMACRSRKYVSLYEETFDL